MSENIPAEILERAKEVRGKLLPIKSKVAYEKVYETFTQWKKEKGVNGVTEDVILAYLDERVSSIHNKMSNLNEIWYIFIVTEIMSSFFMAGIFYVKSYSEGQGEYYH